MKYQDSLIKEKKKRPALWILLFLVLIASVLYLIKINKFEYEGDLDFVDLRVVKIFSLNLLKDQPIFFINKSRFESELKNELPQIREFSYQIVNSNTLKIKITAENICCVVRDTNEKNFVVSSEGLVLRELEGKANKDIVLIINQPLSTNLNLNKNLINTIRKIYNNEIKFEDLRDNQIVIENSYIYFYTNNSKQIIVNENSDFVKFNEKYKSIKSYLEQNQKNYSILDFRFEKIVVK